MSEFFTLLVRGAEEGWVWLYTAGMPEAARADRVAELESDAWEHEQEAARRGERFGLQLLYRFLLGMPSDLGWRTGLGRDGLDRAAWQQAAIAVLLAVGTCGFLPLSLALSPHASFDGGSGASNVVFAMDAFVCILVLVLPGVLAIERWPVAGGLLICVGCLCLAALFWWLREAVIVLAFGLGASAVGMVRLRRMQRRP